MNGYGYLSPSYLNSSSKNIISHYLSNSDDLFTRQYKYLPNSKYKIASPQASYLNSFNSFNLKRLEPYDPFMYNANSKTRHEFVKSLNLEERLDDEPDLMKMYNSSRQVNNNAVNNQANNTNDIRSTDSSSLETIKSFDTKTAQKKKQLTSDSLYASTEKSVRSNPNGYLGHFKDELHRYNEEKAKKKYSYKDYKYFKDNAGFGLDFLDQQHTRENTELKLEKVQKRNEYSKYVKQRNQMKQKFKSTPNFNYLPELKSNIINKNIKVVNMPNSNRYENYFKDLTRDQ